MRRLRVGRLSTCDYVVRDDLSVAAVHCQFYDQGDGQIAVAPLDAAAPTWLNGRPLDGPRRVYEGDVVRVGRTLLHIPAVAGPRPAPSPVEYPPTTSPGYTSNTATAGHTERVTFTQRWDHRPWNG